MKILSSIKSKYCKIINDISLSDYILRFIVALFCIVLQIIMYVCDCIEYTILPSIIILIYVTVELILIAKQIIPNYEKKCDTLSSVNAQLINHNQKLSNANNEYKLEMDLMKKRLEELEMSNKSVDIKLDLIYDLYQIYLLIRKYNIVNYNIVYCDDVIDAHVYCTMASYTKMTIAKDILATVNYHILGTEVVFNANKEREKNNE